jgi:hypothetical protein
MVHSLFNVDGRRLWPAYHSCCPLLSSNHRRRQQYPFSLSLYLSLVGLDSFFSSSSSFFSCLLAIVAAAAAAANAVAYDDLRCVGRLTLAQSMDPMPTMRYLSRSNFGDFAAHTQVLKYVVRLASRQCVGGGGNHLLFSIHQ